MLSLRQTRPFLFSLLFSMIAAGVSGETGEAKSAQVADLAFLAGTWRGTSSTGLEAEELISEPRGGVMLASAREFKGGRCVFFDLVVFAERDGELVLLPHPNGRRSPHVFKMVALDVAALRVEFANPENDFPQRFVYEVDEDGALRITLAGAGRTEVYTLQRVARE